jgi:hypothetical protein
MIIRVKDVVKEAFVANRSVTYCLGTSHPPLSGILRLCHTGSVIFIETKYLEHVYAWIIRLCSIMTSSSLKRKTFFVGLLSQYCCT